MPRFIFLLLLALAVAAPAAYAGKKKIDRIEASKLFHCAKALDTALGKRIPKGGKYVTPDGTNGVVYIGGERGAANMLVVAGVANYKTSGEDARDDLVTRKEPGFYIFSQTSNLKYYDVSFISRGQSFKTASSYYISQYVPVKLRHFHSTKTVYISPGSHFTNLKASTKKYTDMKLVGEDKGQPAEIEGTPDGLWEPLEQGLMSPLEDALRQRLRDVPGVYAIMMDDYLKCKGRVGNCSRAAAGPFYNAVNACKPALEGEDYKSMLKRMEEIHAETEESLKEVLKKKAALKNSSRSDAR